MIEFAQETIAKAEACAAEGASLEEVLALLRVLDLDSFGLLLLDMPNERWPTLSSLLPSAPTEEIQRHLTGGAGRFLLALSVAFIRSIAYRFLHQTGRSLSGARMLDFGYGFGRLTRLMLRYTDPSNLYGCDPAPRSAEWATEYRLPGNFATSEALPRTLPFGSVLFDLIYSFSVFTHLSEEATQVALNSLAARLSPVGLMAITIRPVGFWQTQVALPEEERERLTAEHDQYGFAFRPNTAHFGNTSLSLDWLRRVLPQLDIVAYDWALNNPHQIVVFLTPSWRFIGRAPT